MHRVWMVAYDTLLDFSFSIFYQGYQVLSRVGIFASLLILNIIHAVNKKFKILMFLSYNVDSLRFFKVI